MLLSAILIFAACATSPGTNPSPNQAQVDGQNCSEIRQSPVSKGPSHGKTAQSLPPGEPSTINDYKGEVDAFEPVYNDDGDVVAFIDLGTIGSAWDCQFYTGAPFLAVYNYSTFDWSEFYP